MREPISYKKNPRAKIYDDGKWVYYEFPFSISPNDPRWQLSARRLMENDRDEFEKYCTPFKIATPLEGIFQGDNGVLPWFTPMQRGDFPPYIDATWAKVALSVAVVDQDKSRDQRSILYGTYSEESNTFFFDPDDTNSGQILLVFQNTLLSSSVIFQSFTEKNNGKHYVNVEFIMNDKIDEFIIMNLSAAQDALGFKHYGSTKGRSGMEPLIKRLHDNIMQHEKYSEVIKKRDIGVVLSDEERIEEIRDILAAIRMISDDLVDIDLNMGFIILDTDEWFSINGRRYSYTADTAEHLRRIVQIAREKPLKKLVPLQLKQVRSQMDTCIMQLHEIPVMAGTFH